MLLPSEANRFLDKLKKRERQLGAALERAEKNGLPVQMVDLYRATVAAHEAVQHEVLRLLDVVNTSFYRDDADGSDPDALARIEGRAKALERDIEAFMGSSPDLAQDAARSRFVALSREWIELEAERLSLVRKLGVRGGVAKFLQMLYEDLKRNVLDFDAPTRRREAGVDAAHTGADVAADAATGALTAGAGALSAAGGVLVGSATCWIAISTAR